MYLLETSLLFELQKARPDPGVTEWIRFAGDVATYSSVVVVGELWKGTYGVVDAARRVRLQRFIQQVVEFFGVRLLPVTLDIARAWGEINADALRRGAPLPAIDSLIATTARVHGLTVVTRNVRDFERCGASVVNPWSASR
jgi:predicted nucleic acid-binding protein